MRAARAIGDLDVEFEIAGREYPWRAEFGKPARIVGFLGEAKIDARKERRRGSPEHFPAIEGAFRKTAVDQYERDAATCGFLDKTEPGIDHERRADDEHGVSASKCRWATVT